MAKYNEENERIKRKYFTFLKEAKQQDEATLDAVAKAIRRFEEYTSFKSFKQFHHQQAVGFKRVLGEQTNVNTGKPLSKSTMNSTVRHLKTFFEWLSQQLGYKSRIQYCDAEYFNLSEKDVRRATAVRPKQVATLEQVRHAISLMPSETAIEKRDRALLAFILLTGARDKAVVTFKLKHIDLEAGYIYQDGREVDTKFAKSFMTYFFPVGRDIEQIFVEWVKYIEEKLMFGNDDPLFPKTQMGQDGNNGFCVEGLSREHWASTQPVRKIFKDSFKRAGLPYFRPHSFRDTLARLGEKSCRTPEEFKAWSQNLGHSKVMTTFMSYGEVQEQRQGELIRQLSQDLTSVTSCDVDELAEVISKKLFSVMNQ